MAVEIKKETKLEIGHVLFMDIVGYSKLLTSEQRSARNALNQIVRKTDTFREADAAGRLIKSPTGDGIALVFRDSPEQPVECALGISRALKSHPNLQLRMGIHSGPASGIVDVNDATSVAGAGINMAQRVMDCGDAGHILVSKHVAEDLEHDAEWRPLLHDLGECEVKHGVRLYIVNLYTEELGNPDIPQTFKQQQRATKEVRDSISGRSFFNELKRRRVYRVALAYAVAASAVVQVGGTVLPIFHAAEWTQQLFVASIAIGFPCALMLAWAFDITREGVQRTPSMSGRRAANARQFWTLGAVGTLIAGLALAGYWVWHPWKRLNTTANEVNGSILEKSIAVLPFENLSADKENAYFTDGVQNEILTDLAKIADLKVISRASVLLYKAGNPRNLREIAQQLGVAHVLEGSVQRVGGKVRVNAQLIDARTDKHLWAQSYDRALADVFAIETEVAQAIANELQARLSASEKASIEERPTQDLVAYDFYLRAVSLIYTTQVPSESTAELRLDAGKTLSEAVDLLDKAVARDPNFFVAYCQLAFVHDFVYLQNIDRTAARLAVAQSAIDSAFRLRPDSGEAHLALGWHLYWGKSDYDRARAELAKAQQSLPNNPQAFELAGSIDQDQGRWSDAAHNLERASELDPRNLPFLIALGALYAFLHDYEQWDKVMDRILVLHPDRKPARIWRAFIEVDQRADTRPLRAAIDKILTDEPASGKDPFVVSMRFNLVLFDRELDAAASLAAALPPMNSLGLGTNLSRDFWVGLVARLKGEETSARAAFMRARAEQEEEVRGQPNAPGLLSGLGLIDAALGRKEEALSEGRRAIELLAMAKNSINGTAVKTNSAIICAWTGERELTLQQLEILAKLPGGPSYGDLRLNPMWDPVRGDPRFGKVMADAAARPVKLD